MDKASEHLICLASMDMSMPMILRTSSGRASISLILSPSSTVR